MQPKPESPEGGRRSLDDCFALDSFERLFAATIDTSEQVDILASMNARLPCGTELARLAGALLDRCRRVDGLPESATDLCGTGGDRSGTFNISTVASFVVAGAGIPVAKHGNRSISSKCGSVDCLEELGISVALQPEQVNDFVRRVGIAFLYAPIFHPAMAAVADARKVLAARGAKTVFNILGPLVNPAMVQRRAMGVFCEDLIEPVVEALKIIGVKKAIVYHGQGQDEVTLTGTTAFARLTGGDVFYGSIDPQSLGFELCSLEDLAGGTAADNAKVARGILEGRITGPQRDVVILNAAAGILVGSDSELSLHDGVGLAKESIDSGSALAKLEEVIRMCQ